MSSVERALRKLRETRAAAAAASASAASGRPIAQIMVDRPAVSDEGPPAPRKTIVFELNALRNAGLYTSENARLADEYRIIKQPLLRHASEHLGVAGQRANLIMVGSAFANEGKTFTCVNLSLSLASEKDWQVLLVDVDCKNPQLSELLGVRGEPGLLDLLEEEQPNIESRILATSIPNLSVLPLGTAHEHAAELLASDRMKAICEALTVRTPRRLAVFDSSPLLLTTESAILSSHVGQIVVVVQAGKTPRQSVKEAVQKLDQSKAIGLVLNRATDTNAHHYGGYGAYAYSAEQQRIDQLSS